MIGTAAAILLVCDPGAVVRTPVETVDAFVAAYNARDLAAVQTILSPTARVSDGRAALTGADLMRNYQGQIFLTEPAYVLRPLQQMAAGDMVAQTEAFTGGSAGAFTGLTVYRVDGGCIVEMSVNR